ncbi:hypothetical protein AALB53_16415 [Lachnospiraceae bacterium 47-T17]
MKRLYLIVAVLLIAVIIVISCLLVKIHNAEVNRLDSEPVDSKYDIGDSSNFSADGSLFRDNSDAFDLVKLAEKAEEDTRVHLLGVWIDQNNNVREFSVDGAYNVQYNDKKQDVSGEWNLVQDADRGIVELHTSNVVEGEITYIVDIVTNNNLAVDEDGLYSGSDSYMIVLWADSAHEVLELRR